MAEQSLQFFLPGPEDGFLWVTLVLADFLYKRRKKYKVVFEDPVDYHCIISLKMPP